MLTMLGIPNCDTVKKARKFLDANNVPFIFRDIRKDPLDSKEWEALITGDTAGTLINTRSPSFRKTGYKAADMDTDARKLEVLQAQPTAMKRPAMVQDGALLGTGFSEEVFTNYR